ncbi:MFS transporter [Rossellomorea vietnamensis]|uniref:MFS transporter n=1 Tax=Rossellomorea vietnamensis TaxID=218284 RepID=A0A5D4NM41_9BACI|nr:MFS transporter [Rossellomorea vietnamensis]TYS14446.1 MFS transporter [Rossellomorea vietnamensis]
MIENKPPLWTRNFIGISISNFFLFMTFYFLLVTIPIYVVDHLNGEKSQAGLMITIFLISAILIRPFSGRWIEKYGSRVILLCSLIVFFAASLLYFLADSLEVLFLVRFIHGIGFGMATTAAGSIAATTIPDSRRGEGMGYFILSSNFAMVIGPFLGLTALHNWGITIMLQIAGSAAFLGLLSGLLIRMKEEKKEDRKLVRVNWKEAVFEIKAVPVALAGAFFAIVYSSILSFVSVYAGEIGLSHVASFFFVVYAVVLLLSRPFTGKWYDLHGPNFIVYPAIVLFAAGMLILGTAQSAIFFLAAAAFAGLGWGTLFPTFQTIAIQASPPKRAAMATATFLSIFDIGIGLGSFLVGLAAAKISLGDLYTYSTGYILAGILLYYFLQGHKLKREKKKEVNAA